MKRTKESERGVERVKKMEEEIQGKRKKIREENEERERETDAE